MEEKKEQPKKKVFSFGIMYWIIILILILAAGLLVMTWRSESGWEEEWACSKEDPLTKEDLMNGWNCFLMNCTFVDADENAKVQECICQSTGISVRKICVQEIQTRKYAKGGFNSEDEGWQETVDYLRSSSNRTIEF